MSDPHRTRRRMPVRSALRVLADAREETQIVVTNQGSARVWPLIADHPLDFHYNPSTMGGAVPLGLGLAIANPNRSVVVISGDGALTMSLGSLITVAAVRAVNLTVVVLDNGIYEVTGGQRTAASEAHVRFEGIAKSSGFPSAFVFGKEEDWQQQVVSVMAAPGPRFVSLQVEPALPHDMKTSLPPVSKRLDEFSVALQE